MAKHGATPGGSRTARALGAAWRGAGMAGERAPGAWLSPAGVASPSGARLKEPARSEAQPLSLSVIYTTKGPHLRNRMLSGSRRPPRQLPRWRLRCADKREAARGGTSARPSSQGPQRERWRRCGFCAVCGASRPRGCGQGLEAGRRFSLAGETLDSP